MKKTFILLCFLVILFIVSGCGTPNDPSDAKEKDMNLAMHYYGTGYIFDFKEDDIVDSKFTSIRTVFYEGEEHDFVHFYEIFEACQPLVLGQEKFNWTYQGPLRINSETALSLHTQVFIDSSDIREIETIQNLYVGKEVKFVTRRIAEDDLLNAFAEDVHVRRFLLDNGPNIDVLKDKVIRLISPTDEAFINVSCNAFLKKLYVEVTGDEERFA